jgi:hypothetical protein
MAFPIALIAAAYISGMKKQRAVISVILVLGCSIAQYFFLHNYTYRKGMYEDEQFFLKAGALIKAQPADRIVFINTENKYFPQVEFYGERSYKMAVSVEDARQQVQHAGITSAVFIDVTSGKPVLLTK